ncbi:type II secretion system secretin GspD [Gallaecimonas pentaromativorans]|uniref:type II secretion system secretin GspD n=1 Tax=Gallaecimonas pentaromativorans TaxID=584787 RepID=UPI003A91D93F
MMSALKTVLPMLCLLVAGCALTPAGEHASDNPFRKSNQDATTEEPSLYDQAHPGRGDVMAPLITGEANNPPPMERVEIYPGSGHFVGQAGSDAPRSSAGDVTLNFQDTAIGEVVKTILGDILRENYSIDDGVQGKVSLQTSKPITRDALIPTLDTLLQINGAALVRNNGLYQVVPTGEVSLGGLNPRLKLSADRGYQMLVWPLKYIGAKEMMKLLEPIKPKQGLLEADERRNLLTIAGTQSDLLSLRDTIQLFDVDQLQGMSVGIFRLQAVEAGVITQELEAIFGDSAEGPLAGMVRFLPIDRLNALLVITPQAKYLTDARTWIERLDKADNPRGLNMYVYYVQNSKADRLADMLSKLFEGSNARPSSQPAPDVPQPKAPPDAVPVVAVSGGMDATNLNVGEVQIIADEENNALLIMASPSDYDKVHKAVKQLDVLPLQVLVEATIVEVTLQDELRYGLQWFFKNRFGSKSGIGSLGTRPLSSPTDYLASATYEVFDATATRLLLNTLASDSKLNVVSSPSLMVLDNHTAAIRVGDQVPVRTSQTTNTSSDLGNITSTIQFKDTGVLLEVTPRVNAGGMVVLDITQEVNDVATTTTSDIDSPTITQRRINTSVAVQSGETLVLGGLIRDNRSNDSSGVPGLRQVPVLGWLFGSAGRSNQRTELVVMITPTAVTDREEARQVTREYRNKLKGVTFPAGAFGHKGN